MIAVAPEPDHDPTPAPDDAALLDAYSRAVVGVVERAGPAVLRTWPAGQPASLVVIRRGVRITVDIVPAWAA